jgi:hypothetical protein
MAKHLNSSVSEADLQELQSSYRTVNSMLNSAKRRGNKSEIRELTRAKKRISDRLDTVKSQVSNKQF